MATAPAKRTRVPQPAVGGQMWTGGSPSFNESAGQVAPRPGMRGMEGMQPMQGARPAMPRTLPGGTQPWGRGGPMPPMQGGMQRPTMPRAMPGGMPQMSAGPPQQMQPWGGGQVDPQVQQAMLRMLMQRMGGQMGGWQ